jgi:hypothetical protein
MQTTARILLCGGLLAAIALASVPTNADMPIGVGRDCLPSEGPTRPASQRAWLAIQRSMSGSAPAFTLSFNSIEATAATTGRRASAGMSCSP